MIVTRHEVAKAGIFDRVVMVVKPMILRCLDFQTD